MLLFLTNQNPSAPLPGGGYYGHQPAYGHQPPPPHHGGYHNPPPPHHTGYQQSTRTNQYPPPHAGYPPPHGGGYSAPYPSQGGLAPPPPGPPPGVDPTLWSWFTVSYICMNVLYTILHCISNLCYV